MADSMAGAVNERNGLAPSRPKVPPTRTLVRTVWLSNATVVWNVRARPRRQMSCGRNAWISRPRNVIVPPVAGLIPEMQSNSDVFPAPLGPTMA